MCPYLACETQRALEEFIGIMAADAAAQVAVVLALVIRLVLMMVR